MMLPPVLEIYVLWHPKDVEGQHIANEIVERFHSASYLGLIGGAVEVYVRSFGWDAPEAAPRPIPTDDSRPPNGVLIARFTAVVPILGNGLAKAVEDNMGGWREYLRGLIRARQNQPGTIKIFPFQLHGSATDQTELARIIGPLQRIAAPDPNAPAEPGAQIVSRDLAQFIAQWVSGPDSPRLKVFISHTKHVSKAEGSLVASLIGTVRSVIQRTRLTDFFDAQHLQPGDDFDAQLRSCAGHGALIALRTDVYASREYCQLEMITSKDAGLAIVMLDALETQEERGSFIMDHVPRTATRHDGQRWQEADVFRALGLLVDEVLKRALWKRQAELAEGVTGLDVAWWAPHAPEPITLTEWLCLEKQKRRRGKLSKNKPLRILHPDPPLSVHERDKLNKMAVLFGFPNGLDVMTPRLLAARGG